MSEVKWELIDDNVFVYLVANLLRALEFTAIQYQGDGPDGGLDLFATQSVVLGLQTPQPFRWGIQCKFSVKGKQRSVGDAETRDVEGILRSERYLTQKLRGYMLITNRRITQNVLERLRGIDARSPFRTSALEGTQLELLLAEHPHLIERYFSRLQAKVRQLGPPTLVGQFQDTWLPPIPTVEVRLRATLPTGESKVVSVSAILDPGADMTVVPEEALDELKPLPYEIVVAEDLTGNRTAIRSYFVTVELGGTAIGPVSVIAVPSSGFVLIGRDVMQDLVVLWDGPNKSLQVWAKETDQE